MLSVVTPANTSHRLKRTVCKIGPSFLLMNPWFPMFWSWWIDGCIVVCRTLPEILFVLVVSGEVFLVLTISQKHKMQIRH